jgi:antitoxin ParD1/3/4
MASYSLGEHFEQFIQKQVASGRYNNASEVIRDALRVSEIREARLVALRHRLQVALADEETFTSEEVDLFLATHDEEE